jgi:hypothetical protein
MPIFCLSFAYTYAKKEWKTHAKAILFTSLVGTFALSRQKLSLFRQKKTSKITG